MIVQCLAILGVGLAGGLLPLLTRWSYRGLHVALAVSTGVFLGAVFLHMLPELGGGHEHFGNERGHDEGASPLLLWGSVLVGVLAVYLFETLVFRAQEQDQGHDSHAGHDHSHGQEQGALNHHRSVGWATLLGLTIHAATTGFGLAAASAEGIAQPVFIAILGHKAFEAFSLTSVFLLGGFPRRRVLLLIILFSLVTPLGGMLGDAVMHELSGTVLDVVLALAAGTFLYVCLCELLPEVFHHREDGVRKILLLLGGILAMGALHIFEG